MELSFYVPSSGGFGLNTQIYSCLNEGLKGGELKNANVFFNEPGFTAVKTNFGMFDSTELCHYTGKLIVAGIANVIRARKTVNKFKYAYLFQGGDKSETTIFELVNISRISKIITLREEDQNEFYRLTGVKPKLVEKLEAKDLLEVFDE